MLKSKYVNVGIGSAMIFKSEWLHFGIGNVSTVAPFTNMV